jgi:hypothetical protein
MEHDIEAGHALKHNEAGDSISVPVTPYSIETVNIGYAVPSADKAAAVQP